MELKYKVGCDPEFSILNDGQRVHANRCIAGLFKGDSRLIDNIDLMTEGGEFGCDGCASTGELRPNPALEPSEVADNIRKCIKPFLDKAPQLELSTLSLWAPVGGHVHLELPPGEYSQEKLANVHKKLMSFYLPILMGEHKTNLMIRQRNYGKITDYRCDGDRRTMEIRCPSAEWLTSEKTAKATLAYMSMVWHEIWDKPENLDKGLLLKTQEQEEALAKLAVAEYATVTRALMRDISKNVKKFSLYPKFRQEADFILRPDRVLAEKKRHNFTLNSGWGFGTRKAGTLNKKKFLKAQTMVDGRVNHLGVGHNGDVNTGALCDELTARAMAGFTLKNSYYFYGLKEGMDGHIVSNGETIYVSPDVCTAEDAARIREVARRMASKAIDHCGSGSKLKLDFKTSKIIREGKDAFAIGVPYKERMAKAFRPTLELVWALEKGKLEPKTVAIVPKAQSASPLPSTLSVEGEGGDALETDEESQGAQYARQAVHEVMGEQARATSPNDEDRRKAARLFDILSHSCTLATDIGPFAVVGIDPERNCILGFNQNCSRAWSPLSLGDRRMLWLPGNMHGFYRVSDGSVEGGTSSRGYSMSMEDTQNVVRVGGVNGRIPILGEDGYPTGITIQANGGDTAGALIDRAREAMETESDNEEEEDNDFKINPNQVCAE